MKIGIMMNLERFTKYQPYSIHDDIEIIHITRNIPEQKQVEQLQGVEVIVIDSSYHLTPSMIEQLPSLKLVHTEGVGTNHVSPSHLTKHHIILCNNQNENAHSVAEQTLLLMLGTLRRVHHGDQSVRQAKQIDYKEQLALEGIKELSSCTVGIIGWGAIAQEVAQLLQGFGCQIIYYNRTKYEDTLATYFELDDLLSRADIVSLHIPTTPETKELVNEDFLNKMKPQSILINTARGDLIHQEALKKSLLNHHLLAAGLDTLYPEPVQDDNPLLGLEQILFSPHIGGTSMQALSKMHHNIWNNIYRYTQDLPLLNVVNPPL